MRVIKCQDEFRRLSQKFLSIFESHLLRNLASKEWKKRWKERREGEWRGEEIGEENHGRWSECLVSGWDFIAFSLSPSYSSMGAILLACNLQSVGLQLLDEITTDSAGPLSPSARNSELRQRTGVKYLPWEGDNLKVYTV